MTARVQIVAPTIVRFTMKGILQGRACDNIVDVSIDPGTGDRKTVIDGSAGLVVQQWQDDIMDAMGSGYAFTGAHYMDLNSLSGTRGEVGPQAGHPTTGQATGAANCTQQVSFLVHKVCSFARGQRAGRMYLAPVLEPDVGDDGVLVSSAKTRVQTACNSFRSDIAAISMPLGGSIAWRVVHITAHGDPEPGYPQGIPTAWDSSDVTSVSIDNKVATQRRRLRG